MATFTFHDVPVVAKIVVEAPDEHSARMIVMQNLSGSPDTDFFRCDHWPERGIVAEYTMLRLPEAVEIAKDADQ